MLMATLNVEPGRSPKLMTLLPFLSAAVSNPVRTLPPTTCPVSFMPEASPLVEVGRPSRLRMMPPRPAFHSVAMRGWHRIGFAAPDYGVRQIAT
jgi:hypothetical protein